MRSILVLGLLLLPALFLYAQPSGLYTVTGDVEDPTGAAVAGAKITLRAEGGSQQQSTLTDSLGRFQFEKVVSAAYQLEVNQEGFQPQQLRVKVGNRPPAPLRITLKLANVHAEVTVASASAQLSLDPAANQDTVGLSSESLNRLPVFDQDYVGAISSFLDTGDVGTGGVSLIVDGVESNKVGVSASAIEEVRINRDPYSAEYSRPGHGRIEVITKQAAPQYHGEFNFRFRDSALNARNTFALVKPPEQRRIFEGNLTGPVGRSKTTSFLFSVDREEEDLQSIVVALGAAGPIRQNVPSPDRGTEVSGRITHQHGEKETLSLGYSYDWRSNLNQNVGGFTLPETGVNTAFREHEIRFSDRSVISPKLLNQFSLLVGHYEAPTRSINSDPKIVVLGAFTGGGAQANQLRTEYHFALTEMLSWSKGKHVIKAGINVPDFSRRGLDDLSNFGGTFSFATVQDYELHRPFSFTQQQGQGRLIFIEKVFAGFIQDEYRLRPNLSLSAGLRYDWQNYFQDNNNLGPRFSLAYAPGKDRKTVVRAGAGVFYDRTGPMPIADLLRYNGIRLRQYLLLNPGFPDPLAPGESLSAQPVSIVQLDPSARIPYSMHFGAGVERQVRKNATLSLAYIGIRHVGAFRSRDINAPLPPFYVGRPDPQIGVLRNMESSGRFQGDSLELNFRGALSKYFTGMAQYRFSHSYNNTNGISSFPANDYNLAGEWARTDWDQRHRFHMLGAFNPKKLYNLGIGLSFSSGGPYTIITGHDDYHNGRASARPPGVPRSSQQGPGYADVDLRWSRDFLLQKSKKDKGAVLNLGLDAFNVFNRVNYDNFVGDLSSPFFGHAISAQPGRRLQASLRFTF